MAVKFPDQLAKVLLELVCYLGSFLEPYEELLPSKGPLRAMVETVKAARKAYNIKHGLIDIDDQQFFDDDEDDDEDALQVEEVEEEEYRDPDLGWVVPVDPAVAAEALEGAAQMLDAAEASEGEAEMLDAVETLAAADSVSDDADLPDDVAAEASEGEADMLDAAETSAEAETSAAADSVSDDADLPDDVEMSDVVDSLPSPSA